MWPIVTTAFEAVRGLIGGKGIVQIGKENHSISGNTITGNSAPVVIANSVYLDNNKTDETAPFEPTQEEKEILVEMLGSSEGALCNSVSGGFVVLRIDGRELYPFLDDQAQARWCLAFRRLQECGYLANLGGEENIYHLSNTGRILAKSLIAAQNDVQLT